MNNQYLMSLRALHYVRSAEKGMGVDSLRSVDISKKGPIIRPYSAHGTPRRKHTITDRSARKAELRALVVRLVAEGRNIRQGTLAGAEV